MLSFFNKGRRKKALAVAVAAFTVMALAGCSKEQQAPQATLVKTMEVIKRDTPIVYDYTGFVQAQKEVNLMAQVSGQITGKYFLGGEKITAGQTLFTIDQRTYQAKVLNAQAGLASAQATLIRTSRDLERYKKLYEQNAVSKQELDNRVAEAEQAQAAVDAQQALLENANIDLGETNVVAPFDGRIDTNDLSVGNYVTAGQTVLATISNTDPVFVEFSLAENEYLKLLSAHNDAGGASLENLTIVLSDGSTYSEKGRVDQAVAEDDAALDRKAAVAEELLRGGEVAAFERECSQDFLHTCLDERKVVVRHRIAGIHDRQVLHRLLHRRTVLRSKGQQFVATRNRVAFIGARHRELDRGTVGIFTGHHRRRSHHTRFDPTGHEVEAYLIRGAVVRNTPVRRAVARNGNIAANRSHGRKTAQAVEFRIVGNDKAAADSRKAHTCKIPEIAIAARNDEIAAHALQRLQGNARHGFSNAGQFDIARHAHDLREAVARTPVRRDFRTVLEDQIAADGRHLFHAVQVEQFGTVAEDDAALDRKAAVAEELLRGGEVAAFERECSQDFLHTCLDERKVVVRHRIAGIHDRQVLHRLLHRRTVLRSKGQQFVAARNRIALIFSGLGYLREFDGRTVRIAAVDDRTGLYDAARNP